MAILTATSGSLRNVYKYVSIEILWEIAKGLIPSSCSSLFSLFLYLLSVLCFLIVVFLNIQASVLLKIVDANIDQIPNL